MTPATPDERPTKPTAAPYSPRVSTPPSAPSPAPSPAADVAAAHAGKTKAPKEIVEVGPNTREILLGTTSCHSLIPSGITLAGTSDARAGFRFERPSPVFVQILACLSGEGMVLVDGEWRRCQPGQAYITPQRAQHAYKAVGRNYWRLVWVMYGEESLTIEGTPQLKAVDAQLLEATLLGLYREQNTTAEHAVLASWVHLLDTTARRMLARQVHDPRMSQLWEIIAGDLARLWTLEDMAQVAGLSPEHLRRLCHATFHRSPMRHLTYLRMRHASELLAVTDKKIEVVGRQVGYDNAFAFSAAFKREIGMTPSSCRGSRAR